MQFNCLPRKELYALNMVPRTMNIFGCCKTAQMTVIFDFGAAGN
jgi:hypothetical protein